MNLFKTCEKFTTDMVTANERLISGYCFKKFATEMPEYGKTSTLLKTALVAVAAGIVAGLIAGPVFGVIIAAVVGIEAFAYTTSKYSMGECFVDNAQQFLDSVISNWN